MSLNIKQ